MPKVLHIGGIDSPHVIGIMEQVKALTGFDQALISYPANIKSFDTEFLKTIPAYYYKYQQFFTKHATSPEAEKAMEDFVKDVVDKEKPDIIHGHYLSKCAVPMYYAMKHSQKPGVVVPWSTWDIPKHKQMAVRIQRCLDACSYVMCMNIKFLNELLDAFKQPRSKALHSSCLVRLSGYTNDIPNITSPRIYVPRRYYQEEIFAAFPKVMKMYPKIRVTALSPTSTQALARKLKIHKKMTFLPDMLSQSDFANMIRRHNIIFSMAPDGGTGGTTMQSAYFGAITIVRYSPLAEPIFKDGVNVLCCTPDVADIENKLIYAIRHLPALCRKFKRNNAFLSAYDEKITGAALVDAYQKMLGGPG